MFDMWSKISVSCTALSTLQILQQLRTTLTSLTTCWPTTWRWQHWPLCVTANGVIIIPTFDTFPTDMQEVKQRLQHSAPLWYESWQMSLKLRKRHLKWVQSHSRSSNLSPIERAYATSLVLNSNIDRVSHGLRTTATYWSKIASGTYPCLT